jgi:hypothetical protein
MAAAFVGYSAPAAILPLRLAPAFHRGQSRAQSLEYIAEAKGHKLSG